MATFRLHNRAGLLDGPCGQRNVKTAFRANLVKKSSLSLPLCKSQARGDAEISRSDLVKVASLALALQFQQGPALAAAKAPKGFNAVQDLNDGYQFLYPFGWQEIAVTGADVVYKDVVEPLESVSVTITSTDRADVTDFGDVVEVSETLAKNVLTAPNQEVELVSTFQRDYNNRNYYEFEFLAKSSNYTRHSLAVVAVANGKFFTLTTGANERRWNKMKNSLQTAVRSFQLLI